MTRARAQVFGVVARPTAQVWAVLRDFCGLWHPAMESIRAEDGGQERVFVAGGDTYRERLTWFSDSEKSLGYRCLEGIKGAERYDARVSVAATESGAAVTWTAEIAAPKGRAEEIAAGTEAIFRMGIAALATALLPRSAPAALPGAVGLREMAFDDLPRLAVTATPETRDDRLCLFLHGIGGGRVNWDRQLAALGGVMRCASLDLRGYGGSTLGARQSTVDDYCADILRVAEVLGARRLVLCGLSYGSWIATSFAMRHPGMLAGLVLSGGCTGMSEAGPEEREAFRVSREVPLNAGQVPADFAPQVVKVIAGPGASAATREELRATMAAVPAATYRDALVCFTNPLERFDFARLTMPVLLMTGENDRLAPPAEILAVAGRIWDQAPLPDVRYEVIPGAGHVCNVEAPEVYTSHLAAFLRRLI